MRNLVLLVALTFVFTSFVDDAEARARSKNVRKANKTRAVKKVAQKKTNSLKDRVDSVKKMLGSDDGRGLASVKKPLEVRGQSRNLSMMLVLKHSKDKIQFVEVRENFEKEIMNTSY